MVFTVFGTNRDKLFWAQPMNRMIEQLRLLQCEFMGLCVYILSPLITTATFKRVEIVVTALIMITYKMGDFESRLVNYIIH